jgi:hypothetical protein
LITRFYRVVRAATGADFDPEAAGAAELHYWAVHREVSGHRGRPELVAALVGITSTVCGLGQDQALPAARERAHACELVDAITAGQQARTPDAWAAIAASLRRSHQLLGEALRAEQRASAEWPALRSRGMSSVPGRCTNSLKGHPVSRGHRG